MRDLLIKLQTVDRRWVYLAIAVACAIPFIAEAIGKPINLSVYPSRETQGVFDTINNIPRDANGNPTKVVLIDSTWDAGSMGENEGQAEAIIDHLFRERIPFIVTCIGNEKAPQFVNGVIERFTQDTIIDGKVVRKAKYPGRVYGKDWVNLGFSVPWGWQSIQQIMKDIHVQYKADYQGTPLEEIPLMQRVRNADDIYMIFAVTYSPSEDWVSFAHGIYGTPVAFGCAGIQSTTTYRFIPSGQMVGMLVSVRGSAEYDALLYPDDRSQRVNKGTQLIVPLAFGHLVIIFAIIMGNIGYFAARRRRS